MLVCIDKGIGISESKGQRHYDSDTLGFEKEDMKKHAVKNKIRKKKRRQMRISYVWGSQCLEV